MLGVAWNRAPWCWIAHGKHPVAGDYFTVGREDALTRTFADWLDRGYQNYCRQANAEHKTYTWRFWLKSPFKDGLAFGVVKNSCDRNERPYPLLLMGHGTLAGWGRHVPLLPQVLEKHWLQMEFIMVQRYADLASLERTLSRLSAPAADWRKLSSGVNDSQRKQALTAADCAAIGRSQELFVPLLAGDAEEPYPYILDLHQKLQTELAELPTALFIGANTANAGIFVLYRSLVINDLKVLIEGEADSCHISS